MTSVGFARPLASAVASAIAAPGLYLGTLTVLAARGHRCGAATTRRFAVVVPAHNEAPNIAATIESLRSIRYPADRFDIFVVADNCVDDTAERARAAGAEVMVRTDDELRGKGFALDWSLRQLVEAGAHDVFVVIDADTIADPGLLERASYHVDHGAEALQVDYRVRNPGASWRTRLLDVAFTCQHRVRARGRATLSLSTGLRGNGMVFTRALLDRVPYQAFSVVEDAEYAILLAEHGVAVRYCDTTHVAGDMPESSTGATSQRVRWELGRSTLRREHLPTLARRTLTRRSRVDADVAADLLMPPLATIVVYLGAGVVSSTLLASRIGPSPRRTVTASCFALALHLAAGVMWSQSSWRALPAIARIPVYIVWKATVQGSSTWRDQKRSGATWTRTARSESLRDTPETEPEPEPERTPRPQPERAS